MVDWIVSIEQISAEQAGWKALGNLEHLCSPMTAHAPVHEGMSSLAGNIAHIWL